MAKSHLFNSFMYTKSIKFTVLTLVSTPICCLALTIPRTSFVSLFSCSFHSSHPDHLFDHPICQPCLSQGLYNGCSLCWECSLYVDCRLIEYMLCEDDGLVCFYHCSIPTTLAYGRCSTTVVKQLNEWHVCL